MTHCTSAIALVALLAGLACSSQVDSDYQGKPSAVVSGRVVVSSEAPPEQDLAAAVVWSQAFVPHLATSAVTVEGTFPAGFQLELYGPPPSEVFTANLPEGETMEEGSPFVFGFIAAIDPDDVGEELTWDSLYGIALNEAIMYVKDIPQSDPNWETLESTALYYNVEPTPGYHLLLVERTPLEQWWPCVYPNLCVEDLPATLQSEERLAWCLDYFEDPEICRSYEAPQTQQELDEHNACSARMSELSMAADGDCPMPTTYPENPEGFDHRVTVTLGAGLDDWVH